MATKKKRKNAKSNKIPGAGGTSGSGMPGEPGSSGKLVSSKKGLPKGWTRATFIIREDFLKKIKNLAYWERVTVKNIIDEALELYMKNKKIPEGPLKKRTSAE